MVKNNPKFVFNVLETKVENELMASDHLPLWVTVSVKDNN